MNLCVPVAHNWDWMEECFFLRTYVFLHQVFKIFEWRDLTLACLLLVFLVAFNNIPRTPNFFAAYFWCCKKKKVAPSHFLSFSLTTVTLNFLSCFFFTVPMSVSSPLSLFLSQAALGYSGICSGFWCHTRVPQPIPPSHRRRGSTLKMQSESLRHFLILSMYGPLWYSCLLI